MSFSNIAPSAALASAPPPVAPYQHMAVILSGLSGDSHAIEAAAVLAKHFDAYLQIVQLLTVPTPFMDAWVPVPDPTFNEFYADMRKQTTEKAAEIEKKLATLMVKGQVHTLEALHSEPSSLAAMAVRCTDLGVLARPPSHATEEITKTHRFFVSMLLESGRPVLVMPEAAKTCLPPRRIMIAWANTKEAARAVHDALPLLKTAETVDIVTVDAESSAHEAEEHVGTDLAAHLARYGITAAISHVKSQGRTVSQALLEQANRARAKLIIAGGYGHSRLREWFIGGTTRGLFLNTPIPIFFAH